MADSLRARLERRRAGLAANRNEWESHWRELSDFVEPRRSRFSLRDKKGQKLNRNIVDSTGRLALRTLQSGLHAGMTSPARPWFRFTTLDPDLRENSQVRSYLDLVEQIVRETLQGSNIYNVLHTSYGDIGLYGQSCSIIDSDPGRTLNGISLVTGTYWLGTNYLGMVDTVIREELMTIEQVVGQFVYKGERYGDPDWSVVTSTVKNLYEKGNYDQWLEIYHAISPRLDRNVDKIDAKNKPIQSVYWEKAATHDQLLREGGYDENPILAPRWDVSGNDIYGRSPGMDALPDVKMLQTQQKRKGTAIDLLVNPPMNAPTTMRNSSYSTLPGAVNFVDDMTNGGMRPVMEMRADIAALAGDIRETQDRVNEAFYANLFLMMANSDRRQITAREIDERHEEKLIGLGPVLERSQNEQHVPLLERVIGIMSRARMLPPPPRELVREGEGAELKFEFISMLAQAQKAVATGGIERLWRFAGGLAAVKPDVLDKLDADQTVDEYGQMLGVPASIIRSDDDVEELRKRRADAMKAQEDQQAAIAAAPAVKNIAQSAAVTAKAQQDGGNVNGLLASLGIGAR